MDIFLGTVLMVVVFYNLGQPLYKGQNLCPQLSVFIVQRFHCMYIKETVC